jgi:hypothetical protein
MSNLIPIHQIKIGERRRQDYGNIQELADSISKYGLLHPVVLDTDNNLVAGGRRLEACKSLGWDEIPCTYVESLPEKELRILELEEIIRRKDLTEYELSRNMVELAEIKAEELRNGFCTDSVQKVSHRPPKPDNIRNVAKEIGVSPMTLSDAKAHVEAVEKYPQLVELPKYKAIETAKTLDRLPEEERQSCVESIVKTLNVIPSLAEKMKTMPEPQLKETIKMLEEADKRNKEEDARIEFVYRIQRVYGDAIAKPASITVDDERIDAFLEDETMEEIEYKLGRIDDAISNLEKLRKGIMERISKPRLVKGGK